MIGQVSKEYGAFETTGAALVAIELAKRPTKDLEMAIYATNIPEEKAQEIEKFKAFGYSKNPFIYIYELLKRPIENINHLLYYKKKMGVNPLRFFFYEANISRTIRAYKPDIIHTHGLMQYMPAYYAAQGYIPLVATMHGYWHTDERGDRIVKATMPFVDNITTLTVMAKRDIIHDYPQKYDHFEIVANGADTNKFYYSESKRVEMRKMLGIDEKTVVFITVASIQERKGQLKFLQFLHESGIANYRYLVIGMGNDSYVEELTRYISEKNLGENVSLIGYIDNSEMYCYYSVADIYAHVSTFEGQSLSEMEAASTGLRVIVNKPLVETIPDTVNKTNNMYYVLDYNTKDFTTFLSWIKQGVNNRHSINYFSWQNIVDKYYGVFKAVLGFHK